MGRLYDMVLITGANGMLAHAFRKALRELGVAPVVRGRADCDIADAGSVEAAFELLRPTLVINCAAYTKVDLAEKEPDAANRANAVGPRLLSRACRRYGSTLVHFSTDYIFDGTLRRPLRRDDPVGPRSAYGKSKLDGEQAILAEPPERWLIVRTAWLYGPNGPNFVQTMLNAARAGKPLRVVDDQVGSPTYTQDLAAATLELLDRGASGVWHVSNGGQATWFEFARAIFDEWGTAADLRPITSADWKAMKPDSATRPAYSVFDLAPLERLLRRPMRGWRDALRAYHANP